MKKIYLFAVIFALASGVATYFFVTGLQHNSTVTGVEETDVVIAVNDIERDTVITPEMLTTVRIPVNAVTRGTLVSAEEVYGYVTTEKIYAGEQVLAAKLTKMGTASDSVEYNGEYRLSYHLEDGKYAYTIPVGDSNAVAFFLRAGDYIDLYSFDPSAENPVLENVEVLEIGVYSDRMLSMQGTATATYALITMSLEKEQVEKLLTYKDEELKVVLVPYAQGAGLTTPSEKDGKAKENAESTPSSEEPLTNRGIGEVNAEVPVPVG